MSEPTIAEERARELLSYSSSGVRSELEQAEGWIRAGQVAGEPEFWRIDAVAGAIGALANAYGRMMLWSRAAGRKDTDLELQKCLDDLVKLRRDVEAGAPTDPEIATIRALVGKMESIHERLMAAAGA